MCTIITNLLYINNMLIEYYKTDRGDCEIEKFILKLDNLKYQKAIIDTIDLLKNERLPQLLKTQVVKKINKKPSLYELRCRFGKNNYRVLFGFKDSACWLLKIFNKKDQKVKKSYIDLAIQRFDNLS